MNMFSKSRALLLTTLLASLGILPTHASAAAGPVSAAAPAAAASTDKQDYSAAERLVFMTPHLRSLRPPLQLRYAFRRSGSLEPGFQDSVKLVLERGPGPECCAAHVDFLSGERQIKLPDLPEADANPVILHFLERDIREMQRLTKGSQVHFRKQIRMAVYAGFTIDTQPWVWRGKQVPAQEVVISPYLEDPNRPRFEKYARKAYRFAFSEAVPGGVLAIRTLIPGAADGDAPLLQEELLLDGVQPPAPK